jgi:lipid A 3-O-deacylase
MKIKNIVKIIPLFFLLPVGALAQTTSPEANAAATVATSAQTLESLNSPELTPLEKRRLAERDVYSMVLENDLFTGTDRRYTNGIRFSYLKTPEAKDAKYNRLVSWLPTIAGADTVRFEYALGQSMYAPDDITIQNPPLTDRPYAGYLYGSAAVITEHGDRQESLQLTAGVVGPSSLAQPTQRMIHKLSDSPKPRGWDTQLKDEPALTITYLQRQRDVWTADFAGMNADFVPHFGGALGNVFTYANMGGTIRIGNNLPRDFGPPRVEPSFPGSGYFIPEDEFGWYLFAGVDGRAVARNIFLDGNTWHDSRSVDKNTLVGDVHVGAVTSWRGYRLTYSFIMRSKEYKLQPQGDSFGIIALSASF